MNRRRARARRRATPTLDQESRLRIEEIKDERRQALAQLQEDLAPAREALQEKLAEVKAAIARHEAVYRNRRSEIQQEFTARAEVVRRAAASGLVVTAKEPT